MSNLCEQRILKELKDIQNDENNCISAGPIDESNILEWNAFIIGPTNTPYEDGLFKLKIIFTKDYPYKAPNVKFLTKIYHPNINSSGDICLDILKDNWSPALTIVKVLLSISSLLSEPNSDDPLDKEIGNLYINNYCKFLDIAKEYKNLYCE